MSFENVGEVAIASTGRSLKITIHEGITIQGGEELYIALEKMEQVLERERTSTSVARRV